MNRIILFTFLVAGILYAQDEAEEKKKPEYGWQNSVVANLSITQNQFDNWSQGGENSWHGKRICWQNL